MKPQAKPYKENFRHHFKRRKRGHDYCACWKYHITIMKAQGAPVFSSLQIGELVPDGVITVLSHLGEVIENEIRDFSSYHPEISVLDYVIMPDHVHLLIAVEQRLTKPVGNSIGGLTAGISNSWRRRVSDINVDVFEKGFNDRILYNSRRIETVKEYIRFNPYRLAVRQMRPDFFQKCRNIFIADREVQAYGNLFLLRNPFKVAVVVHRSDTQEEFEAKKQNCLYHAANGGVVVSAFISPMEKAIRAEVEAIGGRIILVHDRPFAERGKPARHDFELCCAGRLLMVSPIEFLALPKSEHPSRAQCLSMNQLAEDMA